MLLTVTAWPMSSRMPVPDCMWPNSAAAYHELSHAPPPRSTRDAIPGLSPSDVPSGPNAVALATVSATAGPVGTADDDEDAVDDELAEAVDRAEDAEAFGDVAGDAGAPVSTPPEIRS
jgi:hypothetical protein